MKTKLRTHNNISENFDINFNSNDKSLTIQDISVNLEDLLEALDALSLNENGSTLSNILTHWSIHRL